MTTSANRFAIALIAIIGALIMANKNVVEALTIGVDKSLPPSADTWGFGVNYGVFPVEQGDQIVFAWTAGFHGVARYASAANFTKCNGTTVETPVNSINAGSYTLNTTGLAIGTNLYYYCPTFEHCGDGLKVQIQITGKRNCGASKKMAACNKNKPYCTWKKKKCVRAPRTTTSG